MAKPTPAPKKGDACPSCGGELRELRVPSAEELTRARDRENPINLGPFVDSADPAFIKEQGVLARCLQCGYRTRYHVDDGAAEGDQTRRREAAPASTPARPATSAPPPPPAPPSEPAATPPPDQAP